MRHTATAALAVVLLPLAGCGGLTPEEARAAGPVPAAGVRSGAAYNGEDVMFAQMLLAHNRLGVRIAKLAEGRRVRGEVATLLAAMATTQAAEARDMAVWLAGRGLPATADPAEHAAHGGMPGAGEEEIAAVENAPPAQFERKLLDMLIAHQDDAVQLARAELVAGTDPGIRKVAQRVDVSRSAQIDALLALRP
ncbi:uncharacterized protein (DUF305 family) [Thermocatellispora tengchongensis]|uniref:Uncharacterized protein (DUF305 family) n=1 Tax=Thermocatellispora tengchongensis TaxID=1073253 RepID=A0A840P570_9ACTN|nr:DUF305 domain-containing protein [Thermocatellispora tengchongensis]MBB5132367.1 uncharacterized protein (DUF305 family) [Thermocatellispora tengchongensis]